MKLRSWGRRECRTLHPVWLHPAALLEFPRRSVDRVQGVFKRVGEVRCAQSGRFISRALPKGVQQPSGATGGEPTSLGRRRLSARVAAPGHAIREAGVAMPKFAVTGIKGSRISDDGAEVTVTFATKYIGDM